ncbi:MAG TPA: PQQ-binding-like beta-propeller repeat protein [Sedimentisphaerales bacterium]|nr:PQQ-binding-like beta-propeller repeat protein [Sedimentisphaerales bacterium]
MYKYVSLFALYIVILFNPGATKADDWPTFMHDNHRSGVTSEQLELPLSESWVSEAAHRPQPAWPLPAKQDFWHHHYNLRATVTYDRAFHVVGAGDTVFFGSSADDKVYALDAQTGRERWTFFTEGPVRLAPSISGNKVYVGSDDGYVYCLSRDNGSLIWKYRAADAERMIPGNGRIISTWPIRTGILVEEGNLYSAAGLFPNQGTFLFELSAENGSVKWKQKVDVSPQGYMLASDKQLYVPTGRTNPAIFARADGNLTGQLPSAGGTFALLAENVLVTGPGRGSKELNAAEVDTQYKIATFGGLRMLVNGQTAYMLSEKKLSAFHRGRYLELSRKRNQLTDQYKKLEEQLKKMDKNTAEAEQLGRELQSIKTQISELSEKMKDCYLWTVKCEYPHSMIMAGDVLFLGGEDKIAAFKADSGRAIWAAPVDGKAFGLSVVNGGLYVSTDKGKIHCFKSNVKGGTKVITAKKDANPFQHDNLTQLYVKAAEYIIEQTGITKGYCLVLGCGRGRLAYELARRSDLKIIGVEEDADEVAAARDAIDKAGLYGRVVVHHKDSATQPYTKYFANLVISDQTLRTGKLPSSVENVFRMVRPYGGVLAFVLPSKNFNRKELEKWERPFLEDWKLHDTGEIVLAWTKRKELEGAGEWTHIYAEPGNTACSGDEVVKGDMAVQWFGRPGPRYMIDRHHRNVPPLFKNGRLFAPGDNVVFAVDAYNGTIEWKIEVPNSRRLGAFLDCGSMAVDDQVLYVAAEDKCYGFDVRTGRPRITYKMPQLIRSEPREWGYVAYSGNILFGSGRKQGASYTETSYEADDSLWYRDMKVVVSDYLFAMRKARRRLLWKYQGGLILNTTISLGGGRIYFVETNSPKALADKLGRIPVKTLFDGGDQYLVALDARTGQVAFKERIDVSNFEEPVYINYAKDILLLSSSRLLEGSVHYYYDAFDARSGKLLWQANHKTELNIDGAHGEYNRHPTIIDDTVYAWPYTYNLKTGKKIEGWKFDRHGHGCGGISASARCLFWRGGNPWMYDLGLNGGPRQLNRVTRPGCWINIIPAGGLVLIPESSSGCTCGFPLQTSMAFVPK